MIEVPEVMKTYKQWGVWRIEDGNKIPYMPGFKRKLRTNDTKTFSHYESVCREDQICFVLCDEDVFVGIDIDDCIIEGEVTPEARKVIDLFAGKGWMEISPSGTGLKITTQGTKPEGSRCVYYIGKQKFEIYDRVRFWTMTGNVFESQSVIANASDQIDQMFALFDVEPEKTPAPPVKTLPLAFRPAANDMRVERGRLYLLTIPTPAKGQINNTLFKTAGHLWKIVDASGSSMDEETIFSLMWAWCGGCDPGLTEDYLRQRIKNSKTCGRPPAVKLPEEKQQIDTSLIDQWLAEQKDQSDETDEEYLQSLVPADGLIKEIFDFYDLTAHLFSPTIGMATAISFLEALFGRRLQSDSGLRTNDYNVILADSGVGKEMAEKTIVNILRAVGDLDMLCPAGVQSGNGLLAYLSNNPCSLWIKDEFGMYLEGVFGKKKQPMEMQVGRLLLELYGKSDSRYSGNAHAAGKKNEIDQPHLCLLGLSTFGTLFANIDYKEVESGLFSRIAWWPITERTQVREDVVIQPIPESIVDKVKKWLEFRPEDGFPPICQPVVLPWTLEAKERWKRHQRAIRAKQETETTGRAAIWSRAAARTIKLSIVHRGSRMFGPEEINQWSQAALEIADIDWAIKISNWIARTACNLALNNTSDMNSPKAQNAIMEFVKRAGGEPVKLVTIQRNRSMQKNEIMAAALILEREGKIEITRKPYGTKELVTFRGLGK